MRAILVAGLFLVLLLAGCIQGTPDRDPDFTPTCPSWTKGLGTLSMSGPGWFHPNGTNLDARDNLTQTMSFGGRPLDWIELDFFVKKDHNGSVVTRNGTPAQQYLYVEKGTMQVQFYREDTGEPLAAYDSSRGAPGPNNPKQFTLNWEPGFYTNFTLHIDLVEASEPAAPTVVVAIWTLLGDRSGNGNTAAWALRETTAVFWYRNCNSDGSSATA